MERHIMKGGHAYTIQFSYGDNSERYEIERRFVLSFNAHGSKMNWNKNKQNILSYDPPFSSGFRQPKPDVQEEVVVVVDETPVTEEAAAMEEGSNEENEENEDVVVVDGATTVEQDVKVNNNARA
mmetsp:Transcript_17873/g.22537  ORF Transcript_17873/g.22537 Transcript_17873/m.22537 type:complete len:125 (+) Transcript_17873:288-662(+)